MLSSPVGEEVRRKDVEHGTMAGPLTSPTRIPMYKIVPSRAYCCPTRCVSVWMPMTDEKARVPLSTVGVCQVAGCGDLGQILPTYRFGRSR